MYYQFGRERSLLYWGEIQNQWVRRLAPVYGLGIVCFAVIALAVVAHRWRQIPRPWLFIVGSVMAVSVLKLLFVVNERDRLPLTYVLIVLSGLGAQRIVEITGSRRSRRLGPDA